MLNSVFRCLFGLSFGESGALTLENCISVAKNSTNSEAIDQN